MPMNLIDIASWQSGMNLEEMFRENPTLDGVVVKATQGTTYVNPEYAGWVKWLSDNGKPFGLYHYCDGADADAEATHFYSTVKPYIGKGIPVADFEGEALSKGSLWLKRFLDKFYALSGIRAMIYCSLSVVSSLSGLTAHPLWIARYADLNPVCGFTTHPWQEGSVYPWNSYIMHQYTSNGRLKGWDKGLDFDLFSGSFAEWLELARGEANSPTTHGVDPVVVSEVLFGKYGIGAERVQRLRDAGYDPEAVQNKINELYAIAQSCKRYIDGNLEYLNAITWIIKCL